MTTMTASTRSASPLLTRALPYLALAGSMSSVCVGTSIAKHLFPVIGAPGAVAYRVGFAAIIMSVLFRPWRTKLTRADKVAVIRYGIVLGLMNLSFYMSLRTLPLGLGMAIEFLGPLTVSVVKSRRPRDILMVLLAAGGLALLLPLREAQHGLDPVGVIFALGAGVCWGLYIIFGQRTGNIPAVQAVTLGMATASIFAVPIGVASAGAAILSPPVIVLGLGTAILSSAIPYTLDMVAMKRIPAGRFGILMSVEPAVGAFAGAMLLGEHLTMQQWLAIGLVIAASIGSVMPSE
ncbi:hypothetical protein Y88_1306 [Novosphingobium nitrogenifigens DSM 19370]|uniref:EamA domain-containing protein n=1 Tax=Novosphingobium nitrogenifigens DSM 19370 TaxID=983920 RepID=F1Z7Y1_9SPHN|nr:DMT family transporter [Novosphingobium nitrogenifigens]EGD59244.1 hypothetical protein Y88_1306 [Novosphingobium nitrogenifigens DSM 19370]